MVRAGRPWRRFRRVGQPCDPAVGALLDDVRRLRLTLTVDLTAAASAVEAEQPEVASDILAADRLEVRQVADRARTAAHAREQDAATTTGRAPARSGARRPRRLRPALLALPAIPLAGALAMTGAVALGAHPTSPHASRHDVATRPVSRETPGQITHTATTTFRRLEKVVTANPGRSQVVSLGTRLHAQLSALLVTDSGDPRRIGEVRQLLSAEQRLLEGHPAPGVALVLAQSRTLAKLLPHNLSPTPPPPSLPTVGLPAPTSSSVQAKAPKQQKTAKQTPSLPTATSSPTTHPSTSPSHSTHSGDGDNSNDNGSSPGDLIDPKLLSSAL